MSENKSSGAITVFAVLFLICASAVFAQSQDFVYNAQNKRNPFIALVTSDGRILKLEQEGAPEKLLLEGIIYDKQGLSYAIVSGEIVKVGDSADGYQVFKIEKNKVIFLKEGQPLEIELKKEGL
ncbi:MAG: hypothetical protein FJZ13_04610 [Candidatus Omnitrophica bacterium]|nr:hypothetical protein [Candidatus Omnitrophota bacterium]